MEESNQLVLLEDEIQYDGKDRDAIIRGIDLGKKVVLITSFLSATMEKKLAFVIFKILCKYKKSDLHASLYSMIKELAINATKANAKKIFFDEHQITDENHPEYNLVSKKFKDSLTEDWIVTYGKKAKENMLLVCIVLEHSPSGLVLKVKNTSSINKKDENRMRDKLRKGLQYEDLTDYYVQNQDQTEGEGIGLVLNLFLLRAENIDPSLFRIGNVNGNAVARIEIPFTNDFKSVRAI